MLNTASNFQTEEFKGPDTEIDTNSIHNIDIFTKRYGQIPPKSFFKINEVLELLDIRPYVLRFWETEFDKVSPTKSQSGQLIYSFIDVACLLMIKTFLLDEKLPVENARLKLDQEFNSVIHPADKKYRKKNFSPASVTDENHSERIIEELHQNQDELAKLLVVSSETDFSFQEESELGAEASASSSTSSLSEGPSEGFAQDSLFSTMAMETFTTDDVNEDLVEVPTNCEFETQDKENRECIEVEVVSAPRIKSDSLALINSNLQSMRMELNQLRENLTALIR